MITTKQLSFGYKSGRPVFSGLDLSLPQGSVVGLLGKNGEGKTTLLKNLCGQLFSKQGEINVLGFTPRERKVAFLQQVYLLPEEIQVPHVTIRRYFDLYAPFYPNYDEAIARELIETFSLDWNMNLGKVSQGQKKKALIAFALSLRVPLLLLDEPTNGLDPLAVVGFRDLLREVTGRGGAVLVTGHHFDERTRLADRVEVLHRGRIIDTIVPEEPGRPGGADLERVFFDAVLAADLTADSTALESGAGPDALADTSRERTEVS